MFCNSIEEYSLLYLENELGSKEKNQLVKHIKKCDKCRLMFSFIKTNYHTEERIVANSSLLSEKINSLTDKSLYPVSRAAGKQFSMKRVILASVILALFVFTTVNAKTIYKSYKELVNSMFQLDSSGIVRTGTYCDQNYVKDVYYKHEAEVQEFVSKMNRAEMSTIKFNENGKTFKVQIAKGIKGDFISYGFEGYTTYDDYFFNYCFKPSMNYTWYHSIDELLDAAVVAPVPGYIPDGYNFANASQLASADGSTVPDCLILGYQNDKNEYLGIALTRSKTLTGNADMFRDPKAAAGLSESASKSKTDNTGNDASHSTTNEVLDFGEYQAVYNEENINNAVGDGTYKTYKTINIFLGDNAKLKMLILASDRLDKETLIKVAKSIKIKNNYENQIKAADYFRGIEDKNIITYTDRYLDNIKAGKVEFKFKIDKNMEFYKTSQNDAYYIMYRNVGVNKVKSIIPFQINLKEDLSNSFKYADVQILGLPYRAEKSYCISLRNKGQTLKDIHMEIMMNYGSKLELTDQIIVHMSFIQNKVKPLFSNSGHLYYLMDADKDSWILKTMYEVNGIVSGCNFQIDKGVLKDENAIMDFINSLQ